MMLISTNIIDKHSWNLTRLIPQCFAIVDYVINHSQPPPSLPKVPVTPLYSSMHSWLWLPSWDGHGRQLEEPHRPLRCFRRAALKQYTHLRWSRKNGSKDSRKGATIRSTLARSLVPSIRLLVSWIWCYFHSLACPWSSVSYLVLSYGALRQADELGAIDMSRWKCIQAMKRARKNSRSINIWARWIRHIPDMRM